VYAFRKLQLPLFEALVAHPLGLEHPTELFGPGFEVVPDRTNGGISSLLVNTVVPSSLQGGAVYEQVAGPFGEGAFRATLLEFFDWFPLSYINFQYYVVRIDYFPAHPTKVGQHALIETQLVRVFWRDESKIEAAE